jgi:hypothetical protein
MGKYDIVFAGNTSIDKRVCRNNRKIEVIGGSAYNAFCAYRLLENGERCCLFSTIGTVLLAKGIDELNINTEVGGDVIFEIDETQKHCLSKTYPVKNNTNWECGHLHISFRK